MVQEYTSRYYLPCSKRFNKLVQNNFQGSRDLASWRRKLMTGWQDVRIEEIVAGDRLELNVGEEVVATARVRLGALGPEDVSVEAYYGRLDTNGEFSERETVLMRVVEVKDGIYTYQGNLPTNITGRFGYTVRITPSREKLENPFGIDLVTWA